MHRMKLLGLLVVLTGCSRNAFDDVVAVIGDRDTLTTVEWRSILRKGTDRVVSYEKAKMILNEEINARLKILAMEMNGYDTTAAFVKDMDRHVRTVLTRESLRRYKYDQILTPDLIETYRQAKGQVALLQSLVVFYKTEAQDRGMPFVSAKRFMDSVAKVIEPSKFDELIRRRSDYRSEESGYGNTGIERYRYQDLPFTVAPDIFQTEIGGFSKVHDINGALVLFRIRDFEPLPGAVWVTHTQARDELFDKLKAEAAQLIVDFNQRFSDSVSLALGLRFDENGIRDVLPLFSEQRTPVQIRAMASPLQLSTILIRLGDGSGFSLADYLNGHDQDSPFPTSTADILRSNLRAAIETREMHRLLIQTGFTESSPYRAGLEKEKKRLLITAFDARFKNENHPPLEDVREYYESHRHDLTTEGILFADELRSGMRMDLEMAERLLDSGVVFHSIPSRVNKSGLPGHANLSLKTRANYVHTDGGIVPNNLRRMKPGDHTGILFDDGWYVIAQLTENTEPRILSFDEALAEAEYRLKTEESNRLIEKNLNDLRRKFPIVINEGNLLR